MNIELKCPYCDNHQNIDPDILQWTDGDEVTIECKNCDCKYIARGYTTVNYEPDIIGTEFDKYHAE